MRTLYRFEFNAPGLPSTPNSRRHWRAKHREDEHWYALVKLLVNQNLPPKPLERAQLTLTRCSSSDPDYDNLVGSFKPIIDGLRYAGVLTDDKKKNIGVAGYGWERTSPKNGHVRVLIEEIV